MMSSQGLWKCQQIEIYNWLKVLFRSEKLKLIFENVEENVMRLVFC